MDFSKFYNETIKIQKPTITTTATTHAKQTFSDVITGVPAVKQNSKYFSTIATSGELAIGLYDFYFLKTYTTDIKTGYLLVDSLNVEYLVIEIFEYTEHFKIVANIKSR